MKFKNITLKWYHMVLAIAAMLTALETIEGPIAKTYHGVVYVVKGIKLAHKHEAALVEILKYEHALDSITLILDDLQAHAFTGEVAIDYCKEMCKIIVGEMDVIYHKNVRFHITNDSVRYVYKDGLLHKARWMKRMDEYWAKHFISGETFICD